MKKIINYLLQGLLYIAPLGLTLYIIYGAFNLVDGFSQKVLTYFVDVRIPGLGLLVFAAFLVFIGFLGKTIVAKPLRQVLHKLLESVPLLNFIYSALNDVFSAFVGNEKKFDKPVLVRVNLNSDLEKIGFVTEENLGKLNLKNKVAVYFPHSYNFSGELFVVPSENITPLDLNSSDVMKFVVSAGLSGWGNLPKSNQKNHQ